MLINSRIEKLLDNNVRHLTTLTETHSNVYRVLICLLDQIIVRAIATRPIAPSKPHCEKWELTASPLKGTVDGVEVVVNGVVELAPVLEEVLLAALTNTPPAIAGGEMVLAFSAPAL